MATPEKKVKERAKKILDELGAYHFSPATGHGGRKGVPDIIGCYEGLFFGIECKAGKNKPTKIQQYELNRIKEAAGCAIVFTDTMESAELKTLILKTAIEDTVGRLEKISPKERVLLERTVIKRMTYLPVERKEQELTLSNTELKIFAKSFNSSYDNLYKEQKSSYKKLHDELALKMLNFFHEFDVDII